LLPDLGKPWNPRKLSDDPTQDCMHGTGLTKSAVSLALDGLSKKGALVSYFKNDDGSEDFTLQLS